MKLLQVDVRNCFGRYRQIPQTFELCMEQDYWFNFKMLKELGIVVVVHIKPADDQSLAVIAPALLRRASPSRHSVPNIDASLDEAQRRVHIRIARLWHLRPPCR
jgi:hypothetical protein